MLQLLLTCCIFKYSLNDISKYYQTCVIQQISSFCILLSEQRLDDIKYWEKEVDDKLDAIKKEIDCLLAFRTRVEKAIDACKEPLHIAQQCLINRHAQAIFSTLPLYAMNSALFSDLHISKNLIRFQFEYLIFMLSNYIITVEQN